MRSSEDSSCAYGAAILNEPKDGKEVLLIVCQGDLLLWPRVLGRRVDLKGSYAKAMEDSMTVVTTAIMMRKDAIRRVLGQPTIMPAEIPRDQAILLFLGPPGLGFDSSSGEEEEDEDSITTPPNAFLLEVLMDVVVI